MSTPASTPSPASWGNCPGCGAERAADAAFCEECGHDFGGEAPTPAGAAPVGANGESQTRHAPVRAQTAAEGEESPLDLGWTGPVNRGATPMIAPPSATVCAQCGTGNYLDGYCDNCGAKAPDPRDHFAEEPAAWVGGVCDIGRRHKRNEDAMALLGSSRPLAQAVLVVCDGVSNTTDSHIASLAAARAARETLDDPVPRGMGLPDAVIGTITNRLGAAVVAARAAVVATTSSPDTPAPPSCTFVAALIDEGLAVVGNVGDSRAYWLPDAPDSQPRQLSADDSFAAEQIREGMPRKDAETGPNAHAITRWLGIDSPDDLTPHTASVQLTEDGWLMLCSDGLWNYCSDAVALRDLVAGTVAGLKALKADSARRVAEYGGRCSGFGCGGRNRRCLRHGGGAGQQGDGAHPAGAQGKVRGGHSDWHCCSWVQGLGKAHATAGSFQTMVTHAQGQRCTAGAHQRPQSACLATRPPGGLDKP